MVMPGGKKFGMTERGELAPDIVEKELANAQKKLKEAHAKVREIDKKIKALQEEQKQRSAKDAELKKKRRVLEGNRLAPGNKDKIKALIEQENVEVRRLNKIPREMKQLEEEKLKAEQEFSRAAEYARSWEKKLKPKEVETRNEVKETSEKGKRAKETVKREKLTSRPRPIPQPVLDEAKAKGGSVLYLEDSKGNRIYMIRTGKGSKAKTLEVMTEIKGEKVSQPVEASKVKGLLNDARRMAGNQNSDFSGIINEMNVERVKEAVRFEAPNLDDILKPQELEVKKEEPAPEPKKQENEEVKRQPTIRVIPKYKHSGKPNMRKYKIEMIDADGTSHIVTRKDIAKRRKAPGVVAEHIDMLWENFVERAEKGELTPQEVNEVFLEGKANMGVKVAEAQQTTGGKSGYTAEQKAAVAERMDQVYEDTKKAGIPGVKVERVTIQKENNQVIDYAKMYVMQQKQNG